MIYKETEYYLLIDYLLHLISGFQNEEIMKSCFSLVIRIYDDCIQCLPDLTLSFVTHLYNCMGVYHKAGKWSTVITWGTKILEFIEKENGKECNTIRDKIIYLLANAYLKNNEESKSLVCLQLCTDTNTIQYHYLYLLYYVATKNISFLSF